MNSLWERVRWRHIPELRSCVGALICAFIPAICCIGDRFVIFGIIVQSTELARDSPNQQHQAPST
jgi:hypothetical protein